MRNISEIRREYQLESLDEEHTGSDPIKQFDFWWQQVIASKIEEPNAMALSTVSEDGRPSCRIVLLKGFEEEGFIFFTNYHSRKGTDMLYNPNVSLVFFWKELERQVRVEGKIEKLDGKESDAYFDSRPIESKIGAWASPQSEVITSREVLEKNELIYEQKFRGGTIKRPAHWGGYIIKPEMVEFWQGRPGRLHDRIRFALQENKIWKKERLAP